MTSRKSAWYGLALALALLGWGWASAARGGTITYAIAADTSSVFNQAGILDFQFNPQSFPPGGTDTATISNFLSDGLVGGVLFTAGDVSGDLNNPPLILTDDAGTSELAQNFTYGTNLQFTLTLTTYDGSPGATFYFTMYDANGNPVDPGSNGFSAVEIDVESGGAQDPPLTGDGTFAVGGGNNPPPPPVAPEPASVILLGLGGFCLTGYMRWRKRAGRTA